MPGGAHVYILASTFKHLYIGVTTNLPYRIVQHQSHFYPGSFTARHNIDRLVYLEAFYSINEAISREKQLKRWSRIKKIRLIVAANPDWRDLSLYFSGNTNSPKHKVISTERSALTPPQTRVISTEGGELAAAAERPPN